MANNLFFQFEESVVKSKENEEDLSHGEYVRFDDELYLTQDKESFYPDFFLRLLKSERTMCRQDFHVKKILSVF